MMASPWLPVVYLASEALLSGLAVMFLAFASVLEVLSLGALLLSIDDLSCIVCYI